MSRSSDTYGKAFSVFVSKVGTLEATATWTEASKLLKLDLLDETGSTVLGTGNQTANNEARLSIAVQPRANGQPQKYQVNVYRDCTCQGDVTFTLSVKHP